MTISRAAPGRQVSAGSLRVDAARAVMKLRDYQLPEPEMWVLELLRAGVILGAERIRVTGDSDDVRVSWEGGAPDIDDLTTLLDELVNPVADPARRHLRLMATAVNTALGLRPRYVDIYVVDDGATQRVRYTPSILEVDEGDPLAGASKLRHLVADEVAPSQHAPLSGVLVHLRRFPDLGVLTTFVSGREPPELRLVRDSCDDTRVPIAVGDGVLERARSDRDVLRIPLGPGLDGFMALMRASTRPDWGRPAIFEACEQGVLLARHPIDLGLDRFQAVPIRVSVDADRLPTNASRSEVRREEAPIVVAEERVPKVFEELVKRIARELGPEPELEWSEQALDDLKRSAFALLGSAVGGSDFRAQVTMPSVGPLAPLFELPLLRDAFGRPRTLDEVASHHRFSAFVHRGDEPLDVELEEWLGDLVWIRPGEPAEILLAHTAIEDVTPRIEAAKKSRVARRHYLRYPVHEGGVRESDLQLLSISLEDMTEKVAADESSLSPVFFTRPALSGELVLTSSLGPTVVSYLYDGRLLAKRRIKSPISFEAVVSSPLLTPNADFSGILDDEGATTVDQALIGAAVWAAERLARRRCGEKDDEAEPRARWVRSQKKLAQSPEVHAVIRNAIAAHHDLFDRREIPGPLRRAPAFDVVTESGERGWASIDEIAASAEHGTFFTADAGATQRDNPGVPEGRLVVAGSRADLDTLKTQLPADARFFHYERRELVTPRDAKTLVRELSSLVGAAIAFERPDGFGAIGMTVTVPIVDIRHCGQTIFKKADSDTTTPCWIVYEGPTLVPDQERRKIVGGPVPELFSLEEKHLLRAIVQHLVGEEIDDLCVVPQLFDNQVVPMLLERLGEMGIDTLLPKALRKRLRELPLFSVLGRDESQSLEEVEALHPGSLRYVSPEHRVDFDVDGFHPLRAPERLARAVAAMLGKKARSAEAELERRRKRELRRACLEAHRTQPAVPEPAIDDDPRQVDVESPSSFVPKLRLSLTEKTGTIDVLIDDRPFAQKVWFEGPPVDATVRARATAADEAFESVSDRAFEAIQSAIVAAVPALLARLAERSPDTLRKDHGARRLLDWWVLNRPEELGKGANAALETLGEAELFETVQGDRAGALDALRRTKVYIASYVGMWIGPDDGEAAHSLDRPVLRVAEGAEGQQQMALIRSITGHDLADVTKACEQLQSRRRVAQGLVPKPTLHGIQGVSHVHDVASLVGKDRRLRASLGPGEVGLASWSTSRVYIQRGGRSLGSVDVDVHPPVAVTLESPDVPRDAAKIAGYAPLGNRVQKLAGLLVERLIERHIPILEPSEKRSIRSAMLDGRVLGDFEGKDGLPLFETTAGLWLTKNALFEQRERFTDVWYVSDFACQDVALDPERHVFRLSHDEATSLLGDLMLLVDATEELRLDGEARRNQQRRPVENLALEYGEDRAAMAYEILKAKGEDRIEGIVAPLRPGLAAHRGMRVSRERHPLGEHRDPCEWPTRAVVDAPMVEPNRTWSGASEEGEAFQALRKKVRRASERALRSLVEIPAGALEPRRVGAPDARRAGVELPVRGALWARAGGGPSEPVMVVDRGGIRPLRTGGQPPLPIEGRLYVDGPEASSAAEDVARVVYGRMLLSLSKRVANEWDPVKAAHIVHGLATKIVNAENLGGERTWPLGVARPIDPKTVAGWLSGEAGIVWVVGPDQLESVRETFEEGSGGPTEDDPWLVDDGSIAARAILMHLDWRAKRWPPEAAPTMTPVSRGVTVADDDETQAEAAGGELVDFEELDEEAADFGSGPALAPAPKNPGVAEHVHLLLDKVGMTAAIQVVPSRRRSIVRQNGSTYQLTARHSTVVAVQNALDDGDPRASAALSILTARVVGEANRVRDEVTDEHEIEALVTLLGTR